MNSECIFLPGQLIEATTELLPITLDLQELNIGRAKV